MRHLSTVLLLCLLLAGCSSKTTFVLLPDPGGKVGQIDVITDGGISTLSEAGQTVVVNSRSQPPGAATAMDQKEITSLFGRALEAQPLSPHKVLFYFKLDSVELREDSRKKLSEVVQAAAERHSHYIAINGHADRAGDSSYNYELSRQRARQVGVLLEKRGLDRESMFIVSHGEGNPLIPTADGVFEPQNRRVEVIVR